MRQMIGAGCVVLLTMFVAGCTPAPLAPRTSYNPTTHPMKSVVLLTPFAPREPSLVAPPPVATAPLFLLGVVGGLAAGAADQSILKDQEQRFDAVLDKNNFQPRKVLIDAITNRLQAKGYKVNYVQAVRVDNDFLGSYPFDAPAGCDGYLDVVLVGVGYFKPSLGSPYQPIIEAKFKYVSFHDNQTLAQGSFGYSSARGDTHPPLWFGYWDYAGFATNPATAITGITKGLNEAADAIADGLN